MSVEELARELGLDEILRAAPEADEDLAARDAAPEIAMFDGAAAIHMVRGELVA
jgi:hypothetical protein